MSEFDSCGTQPCPEAPDIATKKRTRGKASDEEIFNAVKLLIKSGFYVAYDNANFAAELNSPEQIWMTFGSTEFTGKPSDSKLKKALRECKR